MRQWLKDAYRERIRELDKDRGARPVPVMIVLCFAYGTYLVGLITVTHNPTLWVEYRVALVWEMVLLTGLCLLEVFLEVFGMTLVRRFVKKVRRPAGDEGEAP